MKKIIISAIIILVVITGIICFALYSKNIKLNKSDLFLKGKNFIMTFPFVLRDVLSESLIPSNFEIV